ncbi:hypothetical protein BN938_1586 [Mucinivorans hirudinis]|uniref:Uncharacterized protein n=1 Tax=Mucinivorans hirudinis TaxID=1433126 RepID=A0A060RCV3_9BACT|nr:hypothetical protein BN938_1586 [Mucinivorans hirudinis]
MELPLFMSASSFEYSDSEFILYTGEPKMLFAVLDEEPEEDEIYRFIQHENGEQDYVAVAECFNPEFFEGKSEEEYAEHVGEILDELEGWYISEVLDLDSYDD